MNKSISLQTHLQKKKKIVIPSHPLSQIEWFQMREWLSPLCKLRDKQNTHVQMLTTVKTVIINVDYYYRMNTFKLNQYYLRKQN